MKLIKFLLFLVLSNVGLNYCMDDSGDEETGRSSSKASIASTQASLDDTIQRIKKRYKLLSPSAYRAPVNKLDDIDTNQDHFDVCGCCLKKHSDFILCKQSELYEVACIAAGYKHVAILSEFKPFISAILLHNDLSSIIQSKKLYFALVATNRLHCPKIIVYSQEGRKDALRLIKLSTHQPKLPKFWDYALGKYLGYPEEDIEFFLQRGCFQKKYGVSPEKNKVKFNEYCKTVWSNMEGTSTENKRLEVENLKKRANTWLEENNNIHQLEKDIQKLNSSATMEQFEKDVRISSASQKYFFNFIYDLTFQEVIDEMKPVVSAMRLLLSRVINLKLDGADS